MSEIRFNWSVAFLTLDANVVPDERALVTALQVCAGLSVCQGLVPALVPVAERHERPRFYGSERFSSHAQCPQCGGRVDRGEKGTEGRRWFLRVDDLASLGAEGDTPITMPGCNHVVPLAAIAFEFPTGAARCAIIVNLPVWMDAWFDDSPEVEAGLAALSEAIGTPMRIVRSLVDTHPRARRAIKRLVSEDAAGRPDAVRALCELNEDDPEGGLVYSDYCADHEDALLGVLHTDPCVEVRDCAMWLLVEGKCFKSLYGFVEAHLRQCDDETQQCLMVCVNAPLALYAPLVPLICGLASASSPDIRSNCARALHYLQAHGPEEREVIRALALDVPEPSDYAIHAMEAWIRKSGAPPQDIDVQVLREVVKRFPQSVAASIAKKLVANCAQEKSATLDGVHIVKQVDGFSTDQGLPVARSVEPVDLAALRASYLNNLTPLERGFSPREWIDSPYGVNWDKNMSCVTNVIVSLNCYGDSLDGWKRVNTFFPEGLGLVPFHGAGGNKGFEADIAIGAFNYFDMQGFIAHLESLEGRSPMSFQIMYRTQDEDNFLTINVLGKGWGD